MGKKRIKRTKDNCKEKGKVEPICCRDCYHHLVKQDKTHLKFEEEYIKKHYHKDIFGK